METINKMQKLWKSWKFSKSTIKIKVDSMTNPQILSTGSILEGRILLAFCVHSKTLQIFGVARNKKEKKQILHQLETLISQKVFSDVNWYRYKCLFVWNQVKEQWEGGEV